MDIKLIALDLDGTLLNSEKELSSRNKQALMRCQRKGIEIVPATGRTIDGVPDSVLNIGEIHYAITTNGAVIKNLVTNDEIDTKKLPNKYALQILEMVEPYHLMYDPYINGRGISEERFYNHLDEFHLPPQIQKMVHDTRDIVPNIKEYVRDSGESIEKINLFFADLEERAKVRELLLQLPDIITTSSMPNNLEINIAGATKGEGILRLAAYLGMDVRQTMAFGDGENDYTMIQMAGYGVAMENGDSSLKEMADYVTCSNDDDGVAAALEKLVL